MKKNKILKNHAEWLLKDNQFEKAMDCFEQSKNDYREINAHLLRKKTSRNSKGQYCKA